MWDILEINVGGQQVCSQMRGHRNLEGHQTPSTVGAMVFAGIGHLREKTWNQHKPLAALVCLKPCSKNQSIAIQTMLNVFKNSVWRVIYRLLFQAYWRMQRCSSTAVSITAGVLLCVHLLLYPGITLCGKDFILIHPILPIHPGSGFSESHRRMKNFVHNYQVTLQLNHSESHF